MKKDKEILSRTSKIYFNPKYYDSNIRLILNSLRGTNYYALEIAKKLYEYRSDGIRWNIVEEAIEKQNAKRRAPYIEKVVNFYFPESILENSVEKYLARDKIRERRSNERIQYKQKISKMGDFGKYYDCAIKITLDYLKDISPIYNELQIAEMTVDHYKIFTKFPDYMEDYESLLETEISDIFNNLCFDDSLKKKIDLIIGAFYSNQIKNPNSILSQEMKRIKDMFYLKYQDAADAYLLDGDNRDSNLISDADTYDKRGSIKGLRYYCDLDDIDDGLLEEF